MIIIKSILKIVLYFIIFISILGYILIYENKQYIINNWPIYRCNPVIIPFAGYFGKNAAENLNGCLASNFGKFFKILIKPFQFIIKNIQYLLVDILSQLIDAIVAQTFLTPSGPTAEGPVNIADFGAIKSRLNDILSKLNQTS